jgi:general secretion pathway protein J
MSARRDRRSIHAGDAGFTMIEVLIACSIMAFMMFLAWSTASQTLKAKKHFGLVQDRYREARILLTRMSRDLSMAYLSANEDRTLLDPRTYFSGEASGEVDSITFSCLAHQRLYADVHESDQTVVSYYPGTDPDDRRKTDVFRRESRRLANEKLDAIPGESDVIFVDVAKLEITYWDAKNQEWKDEWDTQKAEGAANRLPDKVRIALTFRDENDKEVTLTTETRLFMQEVLQSYAN